MGKSTLSLFLLTVIVGGVMAFSPNVTWVHVLASTNESLLFGWRRPETTTHYAIELHNNGTLVANNTMDIKITGRHNHMYLFVNLDPGQTYTFQVQACNDIGCGPWSKPLEGTTSDGIPDPPRNVEMLCDHDFIGNIDTVTVTWEEPANARGSIISYNITLYSRDQYRNENGQNVEEKASTIEIINATLDAMVYKRTVLPNKEYTVQMCTINRSGCGPMTNISTKTQCKPLTNENKELKLNLETVEKNPASEKLVENDDGEGVSVCALESQKGTCRGIMKRFYFNKGKCEEFVFGGCEGNGNNFETVEECLQKCETEILDEGSISEKQKED